ncbi:molybdenum cofactor guanylyltransferase [Oceanobacillus halotolerans]|uniref:molybdenum cofactor guanylyltransferase n=1 Tax=Oceanobacillus halotolerans TaxID=2663380 RepID=UPI0013D96327|nr:molybdenum cofactor guanylyltransferase [Oceanobacillus halotolerans]
MKRCGVILSGGKSSRMGKNKSLLELNGQTVIEHVMDTMEECSDTLVIITNEPSRYTHLSIPLQRDRFHYQGPLAGIESGMYYHEADVYFIAACDMPFVHKDVYDQLFNQLGRYEAVVPVYDGQIHPLSGIYKRSVLPVIQQLLNDDQRKVKKLLDAVQVHYVHDFSGIPQELVEKHFFNMNHPEQFEHAKTF